MSREILYADPLSTTKMDYCQRLSKLKLLSLQSDEGNENYHPCMEDLKSQCSKLHKYEVLTEQ